MPCHSNRRTQESHVTQSLLFTVGACTAHGMAVQAAQQQGKTTLTQAARQQQQQQQQQSQRSCGARPSAHPQHSSAHAPARELGRGRGLQAAWPHRRRPCDSPPPRFSTPSNQHLPRTHRHLPIHLAATAQLPLTPSQSARAPVPPPPLYLPLLLTSHLPPPRPLSAPNAQSSACALHAPRRRRPPLKTA